MRVRRARRRPPVLEEPHDDGRRHVAERVHQQRRHAMPKARCSRGTPSKMDTFIGTSRRRAVACPGRCSRGTRLGRGEGRRRYEQSARADGRDARLQRRSELVSRVSASTSRASPPSGVPSAPDTASVAEKARDAVRIGPEPKSGLTMRRRTSITQSPTPRSPRSLKL